jgi:hypothetical protein
MEYSPGQREIQLSSTEGYNKIEFVPKGTEQEGHCIEGTRTIHAFGGKRIIGSSD